MCEGATDQWWGSWQAAVHPPSGTQTFPCTPAAGRAWPQAHSRQPPFHAPTPLARRRLQGQVTGNNVNQSYNGVHRVMVTLLQGYGINCKVKCGFQAILLIVTTCCIKTTQHLLARGQRSWRYMINHIWLPMLYFHYCKPLQFCVANISHICHAHLICGTKI